MYYTIYKVTNKLNNKHYIGKHQTKNLDDGYMGSGKLLKRAIEKHGVENFTKEILHVFDNEEDMNAKEAELVVLDEHSYNLCPGGHGGFGYINTLDWDRSERGRARAKATWNNKKFVEEHKERMSALFKERHRQGLIKYDTFTGKTHSEETKRKISESAKGRVPWNKGKKWLSPGKWE